MKQKIVRRASALVLAGCLLAGTALPALAASAKEEVIYANLDASGTVTGVYAVNSFAVQAGDTVTDHGSYTAVRNMTTTDPLEHSGDTVTATVAEDGKLYYEGTMDTATALPWLVKLTYTLDGAEIAPEELGGKSGALTIRLQVSRNPDCTGDFFDQYALQVTMTLDTDRAQNIVADGATMANVGSNKQLSYILLPGSDSDVTVTADVTDFAMNAISLNGVKLRLNLDLDGADLTGMLDRLQSGSVQLDDGANALADGIAQVQAGLDTMNGKSGELTGGSAKVKAALTQMQTALNGVSASTDQLTTLLDASTQIQNGIAQLDAGAAQLDEQVSYDAYKAILKENGLDLDQLKDGNAKAMEQLEQLARVMPQLKDVILLLKGSSANIDAMETYLNTVHDGVAQLHAGSSTLNSQYGQFDAGVRQLTNALTGMLGNLSVLTDGVNQLASRYGQLDSGLNAYTDGVAQLKAGVQQLTDGAARLTAGTGELRSNVSGIDMGDQLDSLLAGLNGSSEVESFTSAENTDVSAVQFALQTVAIEAPAPAAEPEAAPVALTFWHKLLKLLGLYTGKINSLLYAPDRPARGLSDPALISYLLKMILHQLAVADASQGVFFVGHVVEVGLHHPGDAVVGHQQVGLVRLVPQFVQQVVDALGQLQHALAAVIAVGKAGLGDAELLAVAGCALVLAKALLPQARLTPGGDAGGIGDGFCRVGGAGQGRIQDLVDGIAAGLYLLAQGPGLRPAPLGEGTVGHAADLVFHVPHGLAVAGKIQLVHGSSLLAVARFDLLDAGIEKVVGGGGHAVLFGPGAHHTGKFLHLGGTLCQHVLPHAGHAVRVEGGHGSAQKLFVVVAGQGHALQIGQPDDLLHGLVHLGLCLSRPAQPAVGQVKGGGCLIQTVVHHQFVPLLVQDVAAGFVGDAAGVQIVGHSLHTAGHSTVPLAELDLACLVEHQCAAAAGGIHTNGHAPQGAARVGGFDVFLAGDAVEHAEDDGVRAHKVLHVGNGLVQHGGLHRHQQQVHRLALGRGDVRKPAFLTVAHHRLGGVAGNAGFVGNHLHAGHFAPEQDAKGPQTDEGRSSDLIHNSSSEIFCRVPSGSRCTRLPSSMPSRVSSLSG